MDFRAVRTQVFGPAEKWQMIDFRRSGAVKAISGGAAAEQLSHAMGNTLSASNALFRTDVPADMTTIRKVSDARRRGRAKLREND